MEVLGARISAHRYKSLDLKPIVEIVAIAVKASQTLYGVKYTQGANSSVTNILNIGYTVEYSCKRDDNIYWLTPDDFETLNPLDQVVEKIKEEIHGSWKS